MVDVKIERALVLRDRMLSAIREAHDTARICGSTAVALNGARAKIFGAPMYAKIPYWVRAFVDGYERAIFDRTYQAELVFGGVIGGRFYSTHRDRPDYYGRHGIGPCEYADDGRVTQRGFYWRVHLDKGELRPH